MQDSDLGEPITNMRKELVNWILTINNPVATDYAAFARYCQSENVRYYAYSTEHTGEKPDFLEESDTWTPHIQAVLCLVHKARLSALRKVFPRAHFHATPKGKLNKPSEWRLYCLKGINHVEWGTIPSDPSQAPPRIDWDAARSNAKKRQFDEIPSEVYIRHRTSLHLIADESIEPPTKLPKLDNIWVWGDADAGKSHYARIILPEDRPVYVKDISDPQWDCYASEPVVLLEDLDKADAKHLRSVKVIADIWPFPARGRYGLTRQIRPETVLVTSNWQIREIWPTRSDYEAVERRFKQVEYHKRGVVSSKFIGPAYDYCSIHPDDLPTPPQRPSFLDSLMNFVLPEEDGL